MPAKSKACLLSLTIVISILLRLNDLDAKSIWCDEAITILVAEQDALSMLGDYLNSKSGSLAGSLYQHDVTTALLLHPLTFVSHSEFCMRLPLAIAGILSVVFIYLLGRTLLSVKVGLLSAFLLAVSPYNVWYSQTARPFALSAFFTLVSLYFFLLALKQNQLRHWGVFVVSSTLSIYVSYFGLFVLVAESLYMLLWYRRNRQMVKRWFLSQAVVFLLLLPVMWLFVSQAARRTSGTEISVGLPVVISFGSPWYTFTVGSLLPTPTHLLVALPGLVVVGLLTIRGILSQRQQRASLSFLLLYLFIPYLLSLPVRLTMSTITLARSLILISPAYYILVALGILSFQNRKLRVGFLILLIALAAFCLYEYYTTDIYQGLKLGANYIRERAQDGDAILHLGGSDRLTFEYYIRDKVPMYWAWGEELEAVESGIVEGTIDRLWVVAYRQLSTTERMMAMYLGEEFATEQAYQPMDTLLRQMGFIKVEHITFPGENRLVLRLYARDWMDVTL